MIEWILDNKEWLFSGIGVFVLSTFVWFMKRNSSNSNTATPPVQPPLEATLAPAVEHPPNTPTISDIFEDIRSRPSYQQDQAKKDYLGLRIRFSGQLSQVSKGDASLVTVFMKDPDDTYLSIIFDVDINDFPEFKTMHSGTPFTVEGALTRLEPMSTQMKDIQIIR